MNCRRPRMLNPSPRSRTVAAGHRSGWISARWLPELSLLSVLVVGAAVAVRCAPMAIAAMFPLEGSVAAPLASNDSKTASASRPIYQALVVGGDRFVFTTANGDIQMANCRDGSDRRRISQGSLSRVAGHPNQNSLVIVTSAGSVDLIEDLSAPALMITLGKVGRFPTTMLMSSDGQWVATADITKTVTLWNLKTKQLQATTGPLDSLPKALAFSPDGAELAIGEQDRISYHRLPDLQQSRACPLPQECDEVSCLEYHDDGKQIAVGTMSSMLLVCSTENARDCRWMEDLRGCSVLSLAWTRDGKSVISGGLDGRVSLFDGTSGEFLAGAPAHRFGARGLQILTSGDDFLTYGYDGHIRRWNSVTMQEVSRLY